MITDRTKDDVEYAISNPNSNVDLKGAYNNSDINRVESKVQELKSKLEQYSYHVDISEIKTDWLKTDMFNKTNAERYLMNIRKLRQSFFSTINNQAPTTMDNFDYESANDIEKILVNLENLILSMEKYFIRCGVANCGQSRTWQYRWRKSAEPQELKTWDELEQSTWNEFDSETWENIG